MMKTVFGGAFLAVLVAVGSPSAAGSLAPRDGWKVVDTDVGFDALNARLDTAIKASGMLLVSQASASAGAKGQGITIPGNRVVGVFRNDFARRMLAASVSAGIEAPIRFYVTDDEDGTATLSWKTPTAVFAPYAGEGGDALAALAAELDGVFEGIAEEATHP